MDFSSPKRKDRPVHIELEREELEKSERVRE